MSAMTPAEREAEARKFDLIASWPEAAAGKDNLAELADRYRKEGKSK